MTAELICYSDTQPNFFKISSSIKKKQFDASIRIFEGTQFESFDNRTKHNWAFERSKIGIFRGSKVGPFLRVQSWAFFEGPKSGLF